MFSNSNYNSLTNVVLNSNSLYGAVLDTVSNNSITDLTAQTNPYGVYLYASTNNIISGAKITASRVAGIYLDSASNYNRFLSGEFSNGLGVGSSVYGAYIRGSNNFFKDIKANGNKANGSTSVSFGILLYTGSANNSFENLEASENHVEGVNGSAVGIYTLNSNGNRFINTSAIHNYCVNNCKVVTTSGGATGTGISLAGASRNVFVGVNSKENYHSGIYVFPSSYNNSVDSANVSDNDNFGITIHNSAGGNYSNIIANGMAKAFNIVTVSNGISDNNRLVNVTAMNNQYGIFIERLFGSTTYIRNTSIINSRVCSNSLGNIRCGADGTGTRGSGNFFGTGITACSDNGWPLVSDYTSC